MIKASAMAVAMLLVACSDDGAGGGGGLAGSLSGPIQGTTFTISDAISANVTNGSDTFAAIVMSNTTNLCTEATMNTLHHGEQATDITLRDVSPSGPITAPTAPGTYTIYGDSGSEPPKSASISFRVLDDNCRVRDDQSDGAKSGTVTLTAVAGDRFAGSFDITTMLDTHVTGTFAPTACPGLQVEFDDNPPTQICQP